MTLAHLDHTGNLLGHFQSHKQVGTRITRILPRGSDKSHGTGSDPVRSKEVS